MDKNYTNLKLNSNIPFVDAVFKVLEGTETIIEAVTILEEAEKRHSICFFINENTDLEINEKINNRLQQNILPDDLYEVVENHLFSFFTETEMIFGTYEYNKLDVIYQDYYVLWSHRSWGAMIAKWAKRENWLGKNDWNYLDFYAGPNDSLIEDYIRWTDTAMKVIEAKTEISKTN